MCPVQLMPTWLAGVRVTVPRHFRMALKGAVLCHHLGPLADELALSI